MIVPRPSGPMPPYRFSGTQPWMTFAGGTMPVAGSRLPQTMRPLASGPEEPTASRMRSMRKSPSVGTVVSLRP